MDNKFTNINLDRLNKVIDLCQKNYNERTMSHAIRVANYALTHILVKNCDVNCHKGLLYCCALCHDLVEDTTVTVEEIADVITFNETSDVISYDKEHIKDILNLLTHDKEENDYIEYIKKIRNSKNFIAYVIKLADMKDHLIQLNTSDRLSLEVKAKLQKKYWEALPYLL